MKWRILYVLSWLLQPFNRATLRRWVDIIFLGIIGGVVCFLLYPLLHKIGEGSSWLTEWLWNLAAYVPGRDILLFHGYTLGFLLYLIVLSVPVGLGVAILIQMGALRWSHWRCFLLYPSVWLAGLWPVPIVGLFLPHCCGNLETLIITYGLIAFSAVVAMMILFLLTPVSSRKHDQKVKPRKDEVEKPLPTAKETLEDFKKNPEKLIDWFMSDEPVLTPNEDLFEYHEHAHRIGKWITQDRLASVGLIGPYGSGKTTVLNLLSYFLHSSYSSRKDYHKRWREDYQNNHRRKTHPPKIYTCRVEAWGFSSISATEAILGDIVERLTEHVDCLAIRLLPKEYVSAIKESSPKWLHGLFTLLSSQSPQIMLEKIEPLLKAINARLVVYLEDVDRNFRSEETYMEVESLLDKMKETSRMSFVLAIYR